jgi:hypothetical protein
MAGILLKSLHSPDLEKGTAPLDPSDCRVLIEATIGPPDSPGGDIFSFIAVTPAALARLGTEWGRGSLVMQSFSWNDVERMLGRLIAQSTRPTWHETAAQLNRELTWEFDNYSPHAPDV